MNFEIEFAFCIHRFQETKMWQNLIKIRKRKQISCATTHKFENGTHLNKQHLPLAKTNTLWLIFC